MDDNPAAVAAWAVVVCIALLAFAVGCLVGAVLL